MLKRTKKTTRKAVRVLTDPDPQFVSLVSNGANQTPFLVVKSEEGQPVGDEVVVAGKRATYDGDEPSGDIMQQHGKKLVVRSTGDTEGADLQRLVFSSESFDGEKAVRAYLDENGYEGGEITELEGGGFEVIARDEGDFTEVKTIEGKDGVTRYIGVEPEDEGEGGEEGSEKTSKSGEGEGEGDGKEGQQPPAAPEGKTSKSAPEPPESGGETEGGNPGDSEVQTKDGGTEGDDSVVVKTAKESFLSEVNPEMAKKYDEFLAMISDSTDVKGVMSSAADGLPPAFSEMGNAMVVAMRNALLEGEKGKISKIASEFGSLVVNMAESMDFATIPAELAEKVLGESMDAEALAKKVASEQQESTVEAVVSKVKKELNAEDGELDLQLVARSVSEHSKTLGSTGEEFKSLKEAVNELRETVQKQAQTIEDLQRLGGPSRVDSEVEVTTHGLGPESVQRGEEDEGLGGLWKNDLGVGG